MPYSPVERVAIYAALDACPRNRLVNQASQIGLDLAELNESLCLDGWRESVVREAQWYAARIDALFARANQTPCTCGRCPLRFTRVGTDT